MGNKIKNSTDTGISLRPKSSDTLIEKNDISHSNIGILANGVNIRLVENKVKDSASDGIYLAFSSSGTLIEKNNISHSNVGITIDGSNNNVLGNKVSKSLMNGISINSADNRIIKNKVSDSTESGIVLFDKTATRNLVQDNDVSKSGLWGIAAIDNAERNTFTENKVKGKKLKKNEVKKDNSFDLYDESDPLANVWENNKFDTSNF